jgi:hypothetical protein
VVREKPITPQGLTGRQGAVELVEDDQIQDLGGVFAVGAREGAVRGLPEAPAPPEAERALGGRTKDLECLQRGVRLQILSYFWIIACGMAIGHPVSEERAIIRGKLNYTKLFAML